MTNRSKTKGTAAETAPCLRCGAPRTGTKYCKPCSSAVTRERSMHPERRKPCPECGKPKEPGKRRYCLACWHKRQPAVKLAERDRARFKSRKEREARGVLPRRPKLDQSGNAWCNLCEQYLPIHEFGTRGQGRLAANCRSCTSNYHHEQRLMSVFDLSIEQYDLLLAQQEGRCAICMRRPRSRRLAVDHNHETSEIRGLLCTRCNHKILGSANESPSLLRRAANYLEHPPARTGKPLETLGEERDQKFQAFEEDLAAAEDGDVVVYGKSATVTLATFAAMAHAAGLPINIDGVELTPDQQLCADHAVLIRKVFAAAPVALLQLSPLP